MITVSDFRVRFPEFGLASDARIGMFISDAVIEMGSDTTRWIDDTFYELAQMYLVAHLLEVAGGNTVGDGTPAMPIKKTDVDGVSIEFDTSILGGVGEFEATIYGERYVRYRRMAFAGARVGWTSPAVGY